MSRAVLSLGSNLGDRSATLAAAVGSFGDAVVARSPVYATPPWGPVDQQEFFNQVIIVDDAAVDAAGWLRACQAAEAAAGRERLVRWGPRTLDADVVAVTDHGVPVISDDPDLILPHPRAALRAFVLLPWLAVEPAAELPGSGSIADLLAAVDSARIREVGDGSI